MKYIRTWLWHASPIHSEVGTKLLYESGRLRTGYIYTHVWVATSAAVAAANKCCVFFFRHRHSRYQIYTGIQTTKRTGNKCARIGSLCIWSWSPINTFSYIRVSIWFCGLHRFESNERKRGDEHVVPYIYPLLGRRSQESIRVPKARLWKRRRPTRNGNRFIIRHLNGHRVTRPQNDYVHVLQSLLRCYNMLECIPDSI